MSVEEPSPSSVVQYNSKTSQHDESPETSLSLCLALSSTAIVFNSLIELVFSVDVLFHVGIVPTSHDCDIVLLVQHPSVH